MDESKKDKTYEVLVSLEFEKEFKKIPREIQQIARKRLKAVRPSLFEKPKSKKEQASFGLKIKSRKRKRK